MQPMNDYMRDYIFVYLLPADMDTTENVMFLGKVGTNKNVI